MAKKDFYYEWTPNSIAAFGNKDSVAVIEDRDGKYTVNYNTIREEPFDTLVEALQDVFTTGKQTATGAYELLHVQGLTEGR